MLLLLIFLLMIGCTPEQTEREEPLHLLLIAGESGFFADELYRGALKKAEELNCSITLANEVLGSNAAQISTILSDKRFDGIILRPSDSLTEDGLEKLIKVSKVPVITINTELDSELSPDSKFRIPLTQIGSDYSLAGRMAASFLSEELGRSGDLYINSSNPASAHHERTILSFYASISGNPAMRMVGIDYGFRSPERTFFQTLSILQVHPQLGAVFTVDESASQGVLRCLEETGLQGSLRFVAWGASAELVEALERGYVHGLIDDDPGGVGREAVHWLARFLREEVRVPERISTEFRLRTYAEEEP